MTARRPLHMPCALAARCPRLNRREWELEGPCSFERIVVSIPPLTDSDCYRAIAEQAARSGEAAHGASTQGRMVHLSVSVLGSGGPPPAQAARVGVCGARRKRGGEDGRADRASCPVVLDSARPVGGSPWPQSRRPLKQPGAEGGAGTSVPPGSGRSGRAPTSQERAGGSLCSMWLLQRSKSFM